MKLRFRIAAAAAAGAFLMSPLTASAAVTIPPDDLLMNTPNSSRAKEYNMMAKLRDLIKGSPGGSTIRGSIFSLTVEFITDELIDAQKRGVNLHLVARDSGWNGEMSRLSSAISKNKPGQTSYFKLCKDSCGRTKPGGTQHSKNFTFSITNGVKMVTYISGGNISVSGSEEQWNTAKVIYNNSCIYTPMYKYIEEMRFDRDMTKGSVAKCGRYSLYLYPKVRVSHPIYLNLKRVTKAMAKSGCTIRIPMFYWTDDELRTAKLLAQAKNWGCDVQAIIKEGSTGSKVKATLKAAKIPTWDSWTSAGYSHKKDCTIATKTLTISITGSQNLTKSAQYWGGKPSVNTDTSITDTDKNVAKAMIAKFDEMKATMGKRLW